MLTKVVLIMKETMIMFLPTHLRAYIPMYLLKHGFRDVSKYLCISMPFNDQEVYKYMHRDIFVSVVCCMCRSMLTSLHGLTVKSHSKRAYM